MEKFLSNYLNSFQEQGRYFFNKKEAMSKLGLSEGAFKMACHRLSQKDRVAFISKGFYVIVPLEYRKSKILPPSWFINDFMNYLEANYYVGLLSAAACYGASPQQPQSFQVMTDHPRRAIEVEGLFLSFSVKKSMSETPVQRIKTPTGFMKVSTPAATALDLVQFANQLGGLGSVVEVLEELSEAISPADLLKSAQAESKLTYVQRLGYLLDHLGQKQLNQPLADWLETQDPRMTPLDPRETKAKSIKIPHWKLWNNALELFS